LRVSPSYLVHGSGEQVDKVDRLCGVSRISLVKDKYATSAQVGIASDLSYNRTWVGLWAMVQERPVRVERRLSAILAADVAGYSRLMHNDEEATHAKLTVLLATSSSRQLMSTAAALSKTPAMGFWRSFLARSEQFELLSSFRPASAM
jgi:hypothetical protein